MRSEKATTVTTSRLDDSALSRDSLLQPRDEL
jgi:hypothetical protein